MLTLGHINLDHAAAVPDLRCGKWLGAVAFETIPATPFDPAIIAIGTPLIAPRCGVIETWGTRAESARGQLGELRYRHDGRVLFGSIGLGESDFADTAAATALQQATAVAYRQIFELLDQLSFRHLWRVWNFIPRINAESAGMERYRQFNIERSAAFLRSGRATEGNVPAASAVGSENDFLVYFLAGQVEPVAIENPRQVSAYRYPSEYGPRSPIFSRANLIELDTQEILFISGTASIVGHRTLHAGDAVAQTAELLLNIDAVIDAANAIAKRRKFTRETLAYRVYIRNPDDFFSVQKTLQHWLGTASHAVYVKADICRADLLVEIEASGGHAMETSC